MLKNLKLDRPIAFIDIETTGLRPYADRIVELSILKIHPDGSEEYKNHRINPEIPIPAETTAVHGITDADVAGEPVFRQYANSIRDFLDNCDMAGFSVIKFDLPCLEAEFARANVDFSRQGRYLIDSQIIYHLRDPRNLQAAYKKYCDKDMVNAHSAEEDAKVSAEVLDGQLEMYDDLPKDVPGLCAFCAGYMGNYVDAEGKFVWVEDEAVCNFTKDHKGLRLKDIAAESPGFLAWIVDRDFSPEVKEIASKALRDEFPQKE